MKLSRAVSSLFIGWVLLPLSILGQNCSSPIDSDFVIPHLELIPELPPSKHTQLQLTLLDSVIDSINKYETPVAIRFTNLFDTLTWNCIASYHPSYLSALSPPNNQTEGNVQDGIEDEMLISDIGQLGEAGVEASKQGSQNRKAFPLLRSPKTETHTTDARQMCSIYAVAAAVPAFFNNDEAAVALFLSGLPAMVMGMDESQMGLPADLAQRCSSAHDEQCLAEYLECHGYIPRAVGAVVAYQVLEYSRLDGWNSEGGLAKGGRKCTANCRPYQDSSSYDPQDRADKTGCRHISLPDGSDACWEPLVEDFGRGYFTRQEHVSAYIGPNAIPRVLTQEDVQDRSVAPPDYDYAAEIDLVFSRVGSLTDEQKMKIEFADDKIGVAKTIIFNMLMAYGPEILSFERLSWWLLGLTTAENDSIIVVWNEKVRHNLIRPTTVAQRLNATEIVETYVKGVVGPATIARGDFQPYIRVMPHAEYPSGSACIFQVEHEWMNDAMEFILPPGMYDPENFPIVVQYAAGSSKVEPGVTPTQDMTLMFENMLDLTNMGGMSRLDGGMHFGASVPAGYEVCTGVGHSVSEWARSLVGNEPF